MGEALPYILGIQRPVPHVEPLTLFTLQTTAGSFIKWRWTTGTPQSTRTFHPNIHLNTISKEISRNDSAKENGSGPGVGRTLLSFFRVHDLGQITWTF